MRKLLIVLVAVAAVVAAVLVYAAFNLNAYLRDNREWLGQQAGAALGREVRFDAIGVSLSGGLGARVEGLRIGEAAGFGDTPFLEVAEANVLVDPWPALRGEWQVSQVVLLEPRIRIVRTSRGLNVESFGKAGGKAGSGDENAAGSGAPQTPSSLPLLITSLRIEDGTVTWIDRTAKPTQEITVSAVDVEVDGIGGAGPIQLDAAARVLGERDHDVLVNGTVGALDFAAPESATLDLTATLGPISIDAAKRADLLAGAIPGPLTSADPVAVGATIGGTLGTPRIALSLDAGDAAIRYGDSFEKPSGVPLRIDGRLERSGDTIHVRDTHVEVAEAKIDVSGSVRMAPALRYDLRLTGDPVPLEDWERLLPALRGYDIAGRATPDLTLAGGGSPSIKGTIDFNGVDLTRDALRLRGFSSKVEVNEERVTVPSTRFALNDAPVALAARYELGPQTWNLSGDVTGLALAPILGQYAPGAGRFLDGLLDADLELNGRGTSWEAIRDALDGRGEAKVRDGVLRELNVADEVLSALTGIQGLTQLVSPNVRSAYPGLLQADDTPFDAMGGSVRIDDGTVRTDDFRLAAKSQDVRGEGWFSLAGTADFDATWIASKSLSDELVGSVGELRGLLDEDGRLRVPFELRGELPGARLQPDLDAVVRGLGRSALESGLDRIFRKDEPAPAGTEGVPGPTPTPRMEEQLLRRGLESLFGR